MLTHTLSHDVKFEHVFQLTIYSLWLVCLLHHQTVGGLGTMKVRKLKEIQAILPEVLLKTTVPLSWYSRQLWP
jgi:hypothetical protein